MPKSTSKKIRIHFELSLTGLLGLTVVVFCVFLWMFLLGIWAGQTVLLPESQRSGQGPSNTEAWPGSADAGAPVQEPPASAVRETGGAALKIEKEEASFFSLQVAAYSEQARAGRAVVEWRRRGFDAFFLLPSEGGDGLYRVCLGRFENLAEANREAERLEELEEIRAFITLVPAAKVKS
jgi:cell division septation protein DedD